MAVFLNNIASSILCKSSKQPRLTARLKKDHRWLLQLTVAMSKFLKRRQGIKVDYH